MHPFIKTYDEAVNGKPKKKKKYGKKQLRDFGRWCIHSGKCSQSVSNEDIKKWIQSKK